MNHMLTVYVGQVDGVLARVERMSADKTRESLPKTYGLNEK